MSHLYEMKALWKFIFIPADNYMFTVNKRNNRRCEICPKLTMKTPKWHLVSWLLTLNIFHTLFWCFYFNFGQLNACWECHICLPKSCKGLRHMVLEYDLNKRGLLILPGIFLKLHMICKWSEDFYLLVLTKTSKK